MTMSITPEQAARFSDEEKAKRWLRANGRAQFDDGHSTAYVAGLRHARREQAEDLEQHRAAYRMVRSDGFESPEELLSAYRTQTKTIKRLEAETADKSARITRLEQLLGQHADEVAEVERLREDAARASEESTNGR